MRYLLCCAIALAMVAAAFGMEATTPQTKKKSVTGVRKPTTRHTVSTAHKPAHKSAAPARPHVVTAASSTHKKLPVKNATTWRNRQTAPSSDRYKEIQQALAAKGYLQPEQATGQWDQNSADALKKFQTEQNIGASGKINSLSLIALGLGPKHDAASAQKTEQLAAPVKPQQSGPFDSNR